MFKLWHFPAVVSGSNSVYSNTGWTKNLLAWAGPDELRTLGQLATTQPQVLASCSLWQNMAGRTALLLFCWWAKIRPKKWRCLLWQESSNCSYPWSTPQPGTPSPLTCSRCALSPEHWTGVSILTGSAWSTPQPAPRWRWPPAQGRQKWLINTRRTCREGGGLLCPPPLISELILVREKHSWDRLACFPSN